MILEQEAEDSDRAEVNQRWVSIDDFVGSRAAERAQLDVIAVQIPSLNADNLQRVRQRRARLSLACDLPVREPRSAGACRGPAMTQRLWHGL